MKRVKSLVFNSFSLEMNDDFQSIEDILKVLQGYKYNDEVGFGFSELNSEFSCIQALMLKRNNTYIQEYDVALLKLVKKQISVFTSVKFEIDQQLRLLTVFGSCSQLNSLKMVFRNIPTLKFASDPITLNSDDFCERLKEQQLEFKITQLTIKSFNYNDGILGRFSGEVSNQTLATDLLKIYGSNVVKLTFQIRINQEVILLQLHPNGSVKLLCEEEDFDYYLNYLKQIIF